MSVDATAVKEGDREHFKWRVLKTLRSEHQRREGDAKDGEKRGQRSRKKGNGIWFVWELLGDCSSTAGSHSRVNFYADSILIPLPHLSRIRPNLCQSDNQIKKIHRRVLPLTINTCGARGDPQILAQFARMWNDSNCGDTSGFDGFRSNSKVKLGIRILKNFKYQYVQLLWCLTLKNFHYQLCRLKC